MNDTELRTLIESTRETKVIPMNVAIAICHQESGLNPWAWNPEPGYIYLWDTKKGEPFRRITSAEARSSGVPSDFHCLAGDKDQEFWAQRASWGLMQVMGAVARQHGFKGGYLTEMLDPATNIKYGLRHMEWLWGRFFSKYGLDGVIAAYNAGSPRMVGNHFENQSYVDGVKHFF